MLAGNHQGYKSGGRHGYRLGKRRCRAGTNRRHDQRCDQARSLPVAARAEPDALRGMRRDDSRSEEHTSELQSLMRTSYAVFCLKKTITIPHSTSEPMHKTNTPPMSDTKTLVSYKIT